MWIFDAHLPFCDSTRATFSVFYELAIDPANSDPAEYRAEERGYEVLHEGEGRVDLNAELAALIAQVEQDNYDSLATFWQMNQIFQQTRYRHWKFSPILAVSPGKGRGAY